VNQEMSQRGTKIIILLLILSCYVLLAFESKFLHVIAFVWNFTDLNEIRPILPRLLDGEIVINDGLVVFFCALLRECDLCNYWNSEECIRNVSCFSASVSYVLNLELPGISFRVFQVNERS